MSQDILKQNFEFTKQQRDDAAHLAQQKHEYAEHLSCLEKFIEREVGRCLAAKETSWFGVKKCREPDCGKFRKWSRSPQECDKPSALCMSWYIGLYVVDALSITCTYKALAWGSGHKSFVLWCGTFQDYVFSFGRVCVLLVVRVRSSWCSIKASMQVYAAAHVFSFVGISSIHPDTQTQRQLKLD